jgi:hypothetical protein
MAEREAGTEIWMRLLEKSLVLSFGLYLVGAQALSRLDVEREPQQLHPHHVQGHNALCKDPQDGVVGVDTVENCTRKK